MIEQNKFHKGVSDLIQTKLDLSIFKISQVNFTIVSLQS